VEPRKQGSTCATMTKKCTAKPVMPCAVPSRATLWMAHPKIHSPLESPVHVAYLTRWVVVVVDTWHLTPWTWTHL
jgi:hypothetical protein